MYDSIILKDLINGKKKNSVGLENSDLAKTVLTDLNYLGAIHFLSLRDPYLRTTDLERLLLKQFDVIRFPVGSTKKINKLEFIAFLLEVHHNRSSVELLP